MRNELIPLIKERYPNYQVNPESLSPGIWLNGCGLWSEECMKKISSGKTYTNNGKVIAIHNQKNILINDIYTFMDNEALVSTEIEIQLIKNVWDGIFLQGEVLIQDAQYFIEYNRGTIHPSVAMENTDNIYLSEGVEVRAGAVLDAQAGPIIIAKNTCINIGALIQGPIYIGPGCTINPGAKLRGNISLGPMCKIGGEMEDVILQGYGNKQHDGYLGHSYLGEWVNLGANTNNSDLKNNYGMIRINIDNEQIETGKQFLGVLMGDYVRTGISTMLNTGTVIGLGANVFDAGFQKKFIPSFQWGNEERTDLVKFLLTAETMQKRRGKTMSQNEKNFLKTLYEN